MLILISLAARISWPSELDVHDGPSAVALRAKDAVGTRKVVGFELHSSSSDDTETQLRARKSKSKKGKGKRKRRSGKRGKRVYKIKYPKYVVIKPNEVTYTSSATDRKGQIVVEDWRQD